jgi:hypothetical protein
VETRHPIVQQLYRSVAFSTLRKKRTAVVLGIVGVGAILTTLLFRSPRTSVRFYPDKDGILVADVRSPGNLIQSRLLRLIGGRLSAKVLVWNGTAWQEQQLVARASWHKDSGYRAVVLVPESRWRIELWSAPKREIRIRNFALPLPVWTNLVLAGEFPGLNEMPK